MIRTQKLWHIKIRNRCMSHGLSQYPMVTNAHYISEYTGNQGGSYYPSNFQNEPLYDVLMFIMVPMVSLEPPLNIDTKLSTNVPRAWLLWLHNDMRPHKNHKIQFLYKKIGFWFLYRKFGFWLLFFSRNPFWSLFFAKIWKKITNVIWSSKISLKGTWPFWKLKFCLNFKIRSDFI